MTSNTTENLTDVTWAGSLAVAVGHKGVILVGSDEGKTWKAVPTAVTVALHRVAVAGERVVVVGEKGTLLQADIKQLK